MLYKEDCVDLTVNGMEGQFFELEMPGHFNAANWRIRLFLSKMRKHILLILICGLIFLTVSCSANTKPSFQNIAESDSYTKSILVTDESCMFELDLENIDDLCNRTVFDSEEGKIILSAAEFVRPDTLDLHFDAQGIIGEDLSTIITASAYDESFLQSTISITPSEDIRAKYSLQTTEFEDFGNHFSITILFANEDPTPLKTLQLTFSNLLLIEFRKNS